jgi:hypothetical protein
MPGKYDTPSAQFLERKLSTILSADVERRHVFPPLRMRRAAVRDACLDEIEV